MILKLYYRALSHGAGKELRNAEKKDFVHNYSMAKAPKNPSMIGSIDSMLSNQAFYEAHLDFMWLTEAEWKSLLLEHPSPGVVAEVSAAITERLFRYHLVPTMAFGEANGFQKKDIRGGKLTLAVEEVSKDNVRLRLEGFALLGPEYETTRKIIQGKGRAWCYEPRLLRFLEYHPTKKKITRYNIVALGGTYGLLQEGFIVFYRPQPQPLGVAFSLVSADVPANRVFPRGAASVQGYQNYFATGK